MKEIIENGSTISMLIITLASVVIGFLLSKTIKTRAELVLMVCLFYALTRTLELLCLEYYNITFTIRQKIIFIVPAILTTILLAVKQIKEE